MKVKKYTDCQWHLNSVSANRQLNLAMILCIVALLMFNNINSKAQVFIMGQGTGNSGEDYGNSVATDNSGNMLIAGTFQNTVDFNPGTGVGNLTSIGISDIFISKLDGLGSYLWAFKLGNADGENVTAITTDSFGDVLITGFFRGTVDFDPSTNTSNLTSFGYADAFVAKYTSTGEYLWVRQIGFDFSADCGFDIVTDQQDNVIVTGNYLNRYAFIYKFDSSGTILWVADSNPAESPGDTYATGSSLSIDSNGSVVITGQYVGSIYFGSQLLTAINNAGFVAKYSSNGTFQWAFGFNGNGSDEGSGVEIDPLDNIIITGSIDETVDVDPSAGVANLTGPPNIGELYQFTAKYSKDGIYLWAFAIGGNSNGLTIDNSGNIYVTGYFSNSVDFDPGTGVNSINASGVSDAFVARYTSTGAHQWAFRCGGSNYEYGNDITIDPSGNLVVVGHFGSTSIDLDPGPGIANLTWAGGYDIFIAKYRHKENQTITFNPLSQVCEGSTLTLNATSSSGLPVTYTSSDPNSVTVSGNVLNIIGTSSVNITASQAGDANYNPAADVTQSLIVNPKPIATINGLTQICPTPDADFTSYYYQAYNGPGNNYNYLWSTGATTDQIEVRPTELNGTTINLGVTVTNTYTGCSKSGSLLVTVNPAPPPTISGQLAACEGNYTTLTGLPGISQSASYTWRDAYNNFTYGGSINAWPGETWSVRAQYANGCVSPYSSGSNITSNPIPQSPSVAGGGNFTVCEGDGAVLTANTNSSGNYSYLWNTGQTGQSILGTVEGYYWAKVIDLETNCESEFSQSTYLDLNIKSNPDATITMDRGFCSWGYVRLMVSSCSGCTYLWSNGATTVSTNVVNAGNYSVTITKSSTGCSSTNSVYVPGDGCEQGYVQGRVANRNISEEPENIEETETEVTAYPNPVDHELIVKLPAPAEHQTSLQMFDQMGRVVEQSYFHKGESQKIIKTTALTNGVYLISIGSPAGILNRKVMVMHNN